MTPAPPAGLPGALFPDPGTGRDWLREELSRPEYQEGLLERVSRWFRSLLDGVQEAAASSGGFSPLVGIVLLVVLVAVGAFLLSRLGANPSRAEADGQVFTETRLDAQEHRRRATAALERSDWDEAVVESVRALAAGLFERGLVQENDQVTVHEVTEGAAALFPNLRERLAEVGEVFDATRYGDRAADEAPARAAAALEAEVARSTPGTTTGQGPVAAVPR